MFIKRGRKPRIIDGHDMYGSYQYTKIVFEKFSGKVLLTKLKRLIKLPSYNNILYNCSEFPVPDEIKALLKPEEVSPWMLPPSNIFLTVPCECPICGYAITDYSYVQRSPGPVTHCEGCSWQIGTWTRGEIGTDAWEYFERHLDMVSLETMKAVVLSPVYRRTGYMMNMAAGLSKEDVKPEIYELLQMILAVEK